MKLQDTLVKTLEPPKKGYILIYDEHKDSPAGFGLRITAKGTRSFILRYNAGGRDRRMTIGQFPTWSLAAARKQAKEYKRETDGGTDIVKERRLVRAQPTAAGAVDRFCKEHFDKLKSGAAARSRLERYFVAAFDADTKLSEVRRPDIRRLLRELAESHGRSAALLLTNLKRFYAWAEDEELIESNPVATLKGGNVAESMKPRMRGRVLDEEEIRDFWKSAETCGAHKFTALALKLVLVTGARPGEVAGMKWAEIDGKTWTVPGSRRGKTSTEHMIPLTETALVQIEAAKAEASRLAKRRKRDPGDCVFPTRPGKALRADAISKAVRRYQVDLGSKEHSDWGHWTAHDLRRTMRTGLSQTGVPPLVAELAIGHVKKGILGVYDQHNYARELRTAHEAWERRLLRIIENKPVDDDKVTPIQFYRERTA